MELSNLTSMLTPPVLYLLLNFFILAIALISFLHHHPPPPPAAAAASGGPPLVRASSSNVLERFRSGLFRFRSGELSLPPATESPVDHQEISADPTTHQTYRRAQSESESSKTQSDTKKEMKKTVSEKRLPQGGYIRRQVSVDEEVDAKADDFINRFRQQLKLQRLDSLFNYKDVITDKTD